MSAPPSASSADFASGNNPSHCDSLHSGCRLPPLLGELKAGLPPNLPLPGHYAGGEQRVPPPILKNTTLDFCGALPTNSQGDLQVPIAYMNNPSDTYNKVSTAKLGPKTILIFGKKKWKVKITVKGLVCTKEIRVQQRSPTESNGGVRRSPTEESDGVQRRSPTESNGVVRRSPTEDSDGVQWRSPTESKGGVGRSPMEEGSVGVERRRGPTESNGGVGRSPKEESDGFQGRSPSESNGEVRRSPTEESDCVQRRSRTESNGGVRRSPTEESDGVQRRSPTESNGGVRPSPTEESDRVQLFHYSRE